MTFHQGRQTIDLPCWTPFTIKSTAFCHTLHLQDGERGLPNHERLLLIEWKICEAVLTQFSHDMLKSKPTVQVPAAFLIV